MPAPPGLGWLGASSSGVPPSSGAAAPRRDAPAGRRPAPARAPAGSAPVVAGRPMAVPALRDGPAAALSGRGSAGGALWTPREGKRVLGRAEGGLADGAAEKHMT